MRNGKSIRQRLDALGFTAADPDDRVHDLLDAFEQQRSMLDLCSRCGKPLQREEIGGGHFDCLNAPTR